MFRVQLALSVVEVNKIQYLPGSHPSKGESMATWEKMLERMRNNPRDWRIEDLKGVAARFGITYNQHGSSHVTFRHPAAGKVTIPVRLPIKPVYVAQLLEMIKIVRGQRE